MSADRHESERENPQENDKNRFRIEEIDHTGYISTVSIISGIRMKGITALLPLL